MGDFVVKEPTACVCPLGVGIEVLLMIRIMVEDFYDYILKVVRHIDIVLGSLRCIWLMI